MGKIEYFNPNPHKVIVTDNNGKQVVVQGHKKIVLDENIAPATLSKLKVVRKINHSNKTNNTAKYSRASANARKIHKIKTTHKSKPNEKAKAKKTYNAKKIRNNKKKIKPNSSNVVTKNAKIKNARIKSIKTKRDIIRRGNNIVGKKAAGKVAASKFFRASVSRSTVSISNNVAIGILSYNRLECVKRLLSSIREHTDLSRVTLFISDESTDNKVKNFLRSNNQDYVLLDNKERLGIAGNSNRLLKCMSRFKHCFLLNDDVEILKDGWIEAYTRAQKTSGMHHFCYRQLGLIGAKNRGKPVSKNNARLLKVEEKPHGAFMYYTNKAFSKVGYFDESWGPYGMEHVDWSNRVGLSGLQDLGFYDIEGSDKFIKIHNAPSKASKANLKDARKKYKSVQNDKSRIKIEHSDKVRLPSISYVIPLRDISRTKSIATVINNIRAQKFPVIDIVIVEEDRKNSLKVNKVMPANYSFIPSNTHFNKSKAFNRGVRLAKYDKIVLHDADIMVRAGYTQKIFDLLNKHDAVHKGKDVIYLTAKSTEVVNNTGKVSRNLDCRNQVGYFEGGSLACTRDRYIKVGGFNADFVGYGCEDCEFFERLKAHCKSFDNNRDETFYHLEHSRVPGWQQCHKQNKILMKTLMKRDRSKYLEDLRNRLKNIGLELEKT